MAPRWFLLSSHSVALNSGEQWEKKTWLFRGFVGDHKNQLCGDQKTLVHCFNEVSREIQAFKQWKNPGWLGYIGGEILPSFIGIAINHYKDPFWNNQCFNGHVAQVIFGLDFHSLSKLFGKWELFELRLTVGPLTSKPWPWIFLSCFMSFWRRVIGQGWTVRILWFLWNKFSRHFLDRWKVEVGRLWCSSCFFFVQGLKKTNGFPDNKDIFQKSDFKSYHVHTFDIRFILWQRFFVLECLPVIHGTMFFFLREACSTWPFPATKESCLGTMTAEL